MESLRMLGSAYKITFTSSFPIFSPFLLSFGLGWVGLFFL